jgi:hypothetical protein
MLMTFPHSLDERLMAGIPYQLKRAGAYKKGRLTLNKKQD